MEEKKLTDEEIVNDLQLFSNLEIEEAKKQGAEKAVLLATLTLDFIHRLQSENETAIKAMKNANTTALTLSQENKRLERANDFLMEENERLNKCVMSEEQVRKCCADIIQETRQQAVKDTAIKCLTDIEDCINGMLDGERYMTKNEVEYLLEHILNKKQEYDEVEE